MNYKELKLALGMVGVYIDDTEAKLAITAINHLSKRGNSFSIKDGLAIQDAVKRNLYEIDPNPSIPIQLFEIDQLKEMEFTQETLLRIANQESILIGEYNPTSKTFSNIQRKAKPGNTLSKEVKSELSLEEITLKYDTFRALNPSETQSYTSFLKFKKQEDSKLFPQSK